MQENNYLDRVLIKLKRKYSKDETVSYLTKKLSEVEIKNGMLISELEELKIDRFENPKNFGEITEEEKYLLNLARKHKELLIFAKNDINKFHLIMDKKLNQIKLLNEKIQSLQLSLRDRNESINKLKSTINRLLTKTGA
jgi:hypothetical protein